jgi:hypothetical protein
MTLVLPKIYLLYELLTQITNRRIRLHRALCDVEGGRVLEKLKSVFSLLHLIPISSTSYYGFTAFSSENEMIHVRFVSMQMYYRFFSIPNYEAPLDCIFGDHQDCKCHSWQSYMVLLRYSSVESHSIICVRNSELNYPVILLHFIY